MTEGGWRALKPARLFRLLSRAPRPTWPIEERLSLAPHAPLAVQAYTETERLAVADADDGFNTLVATCLITATGARVFSAPFEVAMLPGPEAKRLVLGCVMALYTCAPRLDEELERALSAGARAPENGSIVASMLMSRARVPNLAGRATYQERPDRYYGRPIIDLTGGQILAYHEACRTIER